MSKKKNTFETIPLSEIADVLRVPPTLKDENVKGGKKIQVVLQSDLPLYGYVSGANQVYTLSKQTVDRIDKYILQPFDVIIIATGEGLGKANIVSEDFSGNAIATSTLFAVRFTENGKDNAINLASYLNSVYGDQITGKLDVGTKMPRLNIKDFKKIDIPLLTPEIKKRARQLWNNELKYYNKMLEYRDRIEEEREDYLGDL